jgi:hypothetical protein
LYVTILAILGEKREWWHYLLAVPLLLGFLWFMNGGAEVIYRWLVALVGWLFVPASILVLLAALLQAELHLHTSLAGIALVCLAFLLAHLAHKRRSWVFLRNARVALTGGVVLLVAGPVAHFIVGR